MLQDEDYIRMCHALAISAGKKGNHTFGALLFHQGQVILTAENTVNSDHDLTRHAELNLVVAGWRAFPNLLQNCTLYTSTAPCMLCTAAIFEAGIRKIVYSVSYASFNRRVASDFKTIPCYDIFQSLETPAEIIGPVLEDEGLEVFKYWK